MAKTECLPLKLPEKEGQDVFPYKRNSILWKWSMVNANG